MIILFIVSGGWDIGCIGLILTGRPTYVSRRKRFGHSFPGFDILLRVLGCCVGNMKYSVESTPLFIIEDQSQPTYTMTILLHKVNFICFLM